MIRVLVVDDLPSACMAIQAVLEADAQIRVIGQAHRGVDAVRMAADLKPDLVTMDIHMPGGMDGFEATQAIMDTCPTSVVMVTTSFSRESGLLSRSLKVGAVDVLKKPIVYAWRRDPVAARSFVRNIKILARVKRGELRQGTWRLAPSNESPGSRFQDQASAECRVVAIACSTGGPGALCTVLGGLPSDFPAAVLIVQHMAEGFIEGLARSIDERCVLNVRVAHPGVSVEPGVALFAPDHVHMTVNGRRRICLQSAPRIRWFRPAADLLLSSVADVYGPRSIGVILTGMLDDGARGIQQIHDHGGWTIAQEAVTCVVPSMPNAAMALGGVDRVLPLEDIAPELVRRVMRNAECVVRMA